MFSPEIVSSDAFLDMGQGAQCLYFHLGMKADDDGFVNPKAIMRMLGTPEDELKVLLAKRFLLPFESGVVVIKHWLIHNLIRSDLYKETQYKKEKSTLGLNENGAYTELRDGVSEIKKIESPEWLKRRRNEKRTADVPQTVPRLGKVREGKDTNTDVAKATEYSEEFERFYSAFPSRRKGGKKMPWLKWKKLNLEDQKLIIIDVGRRSVEHYDWLKDNGNYIPAPEVYLNKQQWLMPIITRTAEVKERRVDRFGK